MKVRWTRESLIRLREVNSYISKDNPQAAEKFLDKIINLAESIKENPEKGRIVPELDFHNINNYRELIITPWRIIYRIEEQKVYILSMIDSRRNFEDIILKRLMRN